MKFIQTTATLLALGVGLSTAACAVDIEPAGDGGDNSGEESVGQTQEALGDGWATQSGDWLQGHLDFTVGNTATQVCVLSRVSGRFDGGGESVYVKDNGRGRWVVGGTSHQDGVSARALCFDRAAFPNQRFTLVSPARSVRALSGCAQTSGNQWEGDTATIISGMNGVFRGGGEFIAVEQSNAVTIASRLIAQTCQSDTGMLGISFWAAMNDTTRIARFVNSADQVGTVDQISEFAVRDDGTGRGKVQVMAPINSAMCYFTRIGGSFRGGGEFVEIVPEGNNWVLRAQKGSASSGLNARARCFARNQMR